MDGLLKSPKPKKPKMEKPNTVRDIFKLKKPPTWQPAADMQAFAKHPDHELIYGIELEIEHASFDWEMAGFRATEDGSLRNGGVEYVSVPMYYPALAYSLTQFFSKFRPDEFNYSERTSIHVHTNCQDLTIEQLKNVLILYQVFEDVLFAWIGHDRDKNIFCVPWSQTRTTHKILDEIESFIKMSSVERNKYTALNLVPIQSQGTLEWRHMHGHGNVERILQWLRIIGHVYRVARSMDHKEVRELCVNLNTTSQYDQLLDMVFKDEATALRIPGYRLLLENGVLNMKYSLFTKANKNKNSIDSLYADLVAAPVLNDPWLPPEQERQQHNRMVFNRFNVTQAMNPFDAQPVAPQREENLNEQLIRREREIREQVARAQARLRGDVSMEDEGVSF